MEPLSSEMSMTTQAIVYEIMVSHLGVAPEWLSPDADLYEDLGADSLDIVELTMLFEERFDVELPDNDIEQVKTVGDFVNLLEKKVQNMTHEETVEQNEEQIVGGEDQQEQAGTPVPEADNNDEDEGVPGEPEPDGEEETPEED